MNPINSPFARDSFAVTIDADAYNDKAPDTRKTSLKTNKNGVENETFSEVLLGQS